MNELVPTGYEFNCVPHKSSIRRGDVDILYRTGMRKVEISEIYTHFEPSDCDIYCISSLFIDEWSNLLENLGMIVYDLNIHADNKYDAEVNRVCRIFQFTWIDSACQRGNSQRRPATHPSVWPLHVYEFLWYGIHVPIATKVNPWAIIRLHIQFVVNLDELDCIRWNIACGKYLGVNGPPIYC